MKTCIICKSEGNYKCPTCFIYYCSASCCREHRAQKCDVILHTPTDVEEPSRNVEHIRFPTKDTVRTQTLELLRHDSNLNEILKNPHLCNLLKNIDETSNAEEAMQKAMLEPLFVEFADACLKIVEPQQEAE